MSMIDRRALVLAVGMFAIGTDAFVIAGILPETAQSLSVSIEQAGLVVSVFSLSYAIGSPLLVALSGRCRRSTVLSGSLVAFALANLLSAVSPNLTFLLTTRILAGLSAGLFAPVAMASGSKLGTAQNRGKTMGVVVAGYTSSIVLGVPLGVVIGQYVGWRGALAFVATVAAIGTLALYRAGVGGVFASEGALLESLRLILKPRTLTVLVPFLIWSTAHYGLYTFVAPILERHLSPKLLPALLMIFGLGAVAGNLIGGSFHDSHGTSRPTIVCLLLLIGLLAVTGVSSASLFLAGTHLVCWAICIAALYVLQQQRAISRNPKQRNVLIALNNSAMYLGASIGPAIGGYVISELSLVALPWLSSGIAAVGLVTLLVLRFAHKESAIKEHAD
jgi:MFS transporter, DHA1 family, inner membrane transport protein